MSLRLPLLAVAFCAAVPAASPALAQRAQATSPIADEIRREVEQLNREMEAAFNRGDLKGAAAYYADNARIMSGMGPVASGRTAVDQYFTGITNAKSWKLETTSISGTRDVVYQVGKSTLVHGNPEHTSIVQFLLVWERQRDGKLRATLDYYHRPER